MKRDKLIKHFFSFFKSNDLIVVAGKLLSKEIYSMFGDKFLYFDDDLGYGLPMALGLATTTEKRVFFICEDYYLLAGIESLPNMGNSFCQNLFLITFRTNTYSGFKSGLKYASLMNKNTLKGFIFGLGFKTYGYTLHFKTVQRAKSTFPNILKYVKGPVFAFIDTEKNEDTFDNVTLDIKSNMKTMKSFIKKDLGTSLYNPTVKINEGLLGENK